MRAWRAIFGLELTALVRSKTLLMMMVATVAWMAAAPGFLRGDGTADGARELYIQYSLGGVFVLLVVSLLASATGALARERQAKRLQLTMIRPVGSPTLVLAKAAAIVTVGAAVLAVAFAMVFLHVGVSRPCCHVLKPVMPPAHEEAEGDYRKLMEDPEYAEAMKDVPPEDAIRILEQRVADNYQVVPTNALATWRFDVPKSMREAKAPPSVRLKLTNRFNLREDVVGEVAFAGLSGSVSNRTQSALVIPLSGELSPLGASGELVFRNLSRAVLMLRPRKDVEVLVPADAFFANAVRAYLELVALFALVVSLGLFLSAALGRAVAMFAAVIILIVGEMSPSIAVRYPNELSAKTIDRVGLAVTRVMAEAMRPISSLKPIERLSVDECVESGEVARVLGCDLVLVPVLLGLLAGFILPRRQDGL